MACSSIVPWQFELPQRHTNWVFALQVSCQLLIRILPEFVTGFPRPPDRAPFGLLARSVLAALPPTLSLFFYFEHCATAACGATMTFEPLHYFGDGFVDFQRVIVKDRIKCAIEVQKNMQIPPKAPVRNDEGQE